MRVASTLRPTAGAVSEITWATDRVRHLPWILGGFGLLIGVVLSGSEPLVSWAFPRVTLLALFISLAVCIRRPKLAVPSFVLLLAPLHSFGGTFRYTIGEFPTTLVTFALLALIAGSMLLRARPRRADLRDAKVPVGLFTLLALASVPALLVAPGYSNNPTVTALIFVTGTVEPLLLLLLILGWLREYRDAELLIVCLVVSCIVALLVGVTTLKVASTWSVGNQVDDVRFAIGGFGGANTSGFIIVLLYPLIFVLQPHRSQRHLSTVVALAAVFWAVALATMSRATPLLLAVQTAFILGWLKLIRGAVQIVVALALMAATVALLAPADMRDVWVERVTQTDLVRYMSGRTGVLSTNDAFRQTLQKDLGGEIRQRPWGGYAAAGNEDPENLYLDIALQLGWVPAICFALGQAYLLFQAWRLAHAPSFGLSMPGRVLFCALLGCVLYGSTTGVNLVKAGMPSAAVGFQANSMPIVFFAIVAGLTAFASSQGARCNAVVRRTRGRRHRGAVATGRVASGLTV